ncbi:hypothetical protein CC86DRAFT_199410 [Ophiobolus disseminans]|uniref:Uncharacterized protein n=1 Tax=Ophiobolus disseminans TaxID=1469910 RepID=A0A6A7A6G9_9PLEO|nr:hypothetical protein CC86DRAFT_199410 [Ophiobolus disseminans]
MKRRRSFADTQARLASRDGRSSTAVAVAVRHQDTKTPTLEASRAERYASILSSQGAGPGAPPTAICSSIERRQSTPQRRRAVQVRVTGSGAPSKVQPHPERHRSHHHALWAGTSRACNFAKLISHRIAAHQAKAPAAPLPGGESHLMHILGHLKQANRSHVFP